jgi:hypothetical protein
MAKSNFKSKKSLQKEENVGKLPFQKLIILSIIINVASIGFVFILLNHLPPEIPLFFGLAQSEAQLKSSLSLVVPGIIALGITVLNVVIGLITSNEYLRKILISATVAVSILSIITTIKILLLVGSF